LEFCAIVVPVSVTKGVGATLYVEGVAATLGKRASNR
jgi:hypothetical protein